MKKSILQSLGLLLIAGSAVASNTGFKLNYPVPLLPAPRSNNYWMSFPSFYYPNGNVSTSGVQNSIDICADLNEFQTPPLKVGQVIKFLVTTDRPLGQSCTAVTKKAFDMVKGEAYAVVPSAANVVVNVVGSNDDNLTGNKPGATGRYPLTLLPAPRSNNYWVSVPYHALANNSIDLCAELNTQTGNLIGQVIRFLVTTDRPLGQSCTALTKKAFDITPGEGYAVVPTATTAIAFNVY